MITDNISINKLSLGVLSDTKAYANAQLNAEKSQLQLLNLNDIIQVKFPDNQYHRDQTKKSQICLHHTVSGQGVNGDINWWLSTAERIGTHVVIDWQGKIYQCYSTLYWGSHLGVKSEFLAQRGFKDYNTRNVTLDKGSIAIEIDAWGGLVMDGNGKYYPALWDVKLKRFIANKKVNPILNVQVLDKPYRGFKAFEKYTKEQIESVRQLLVFWSAKYGIPMDYNESMWDVSSDALGGKPGIWPHTSFRSDKSDCYPDDNLIKMLKSLK